MTGFVYNGGFEEIKHIHKLLLEPELMEKALSRDGHRSEQKQL